ncbi:hypothetical protein GHT06_022416 [Daphnia sinensis]|uniref:Uncharacterized protein n=1 Tax=Daphnia sinensis TaxID=1820382 RepID=A0AAD5KH49_9CRUS|nr:hypothetical protein GHT06_022416 [Daphnia sinensis]
MVLSVLLNAGAVPLSFDEQNHYHPTTSVASTPSTVGHYSSSSPANPEYVHYLEELVGELSGVFATFIHQNPPPSSPTSRTDMYHQRANTCRSSPSGLLPDVIPKHGTSDKWSCSTPPSAAEDLRMRRGMAPMRFRLDSVGSSVPSATSSAVSTPTSATSFFTSSAATSPMAFDLLPSPTTSSSTVSFFADYPPLSSDISEHVHRTDLDASLPVDATDAADASAADWRQVGRDLRGIADHFASTRRSQNSATGCQQWSLLSTVLSSNSLKSAGPLVSALAVYLWWKLVRRLTA